MKTVDSKESLNIGRFKLVKRVETGDLSARRGMRGVVFRPVDRKIACPTLPNTMKAKLNPILAAGLFLLSALPLHASVDSILTVVVNCYYQQKVSTAGDNIAGNVNIVRVDSKQLLVLLQKELAVNFPRGAQLELAADGKVYVVDAKAVVVTDVSAYISATVDDGVRLLNGQRNLATKQENTRNYYPITLTFNLATLQGTIKGIMMENLVAGAPDRYGFNITTERASATVNGAGSFNGKTAYFDGTVSLLGRTSH